MPPTVIRGGQVLDGSVQRVDLDTTTVGQAVVRKIVQGSGITLSSTGADSGTGDVTITSASATGSNTTTTTTGAFTVPAVGSTVVVTVADPSWMVLNEFVYINNAGGANLAGLMQITAINGNQITLLNPAPAPAIPNASSAGAGLLAQTSNLTTDYVDGTNTCRDLPTRSEEHTS